MQLLVLGGTSFVGRHIVDAAVRAGHHVTLFNRGQTNADLFPEADRRTGDRDAGDYESLADGRWDATVDVNGYIPRHVTQAADALGDRAGRYLFISTGSVYDPAGMADVSEDAPRHEPEYDTEEITNETYGPLKVACEDLTLERFGDQATIVRPGIVGGPYDPTDRFTYWVRRAALGGEIVAPDRPDQPIQVVDGRDQGAFVVHLLEGDQAGIYNSVGPDESTTVASMIDACADAAGVAAKVTWIDPDWLHEQKFFVPMALPPDGTYDGLFRRGLARANAAGMTHRSLVETARDTLAWDRARGNPPMPGAPPAEREAEVLAAWHAR